MVDISGPTGPTERRIKPAGRRGLAFALRRFVAAIRGDVGASGVVSSLLILFGIGVAIEGLGELGVELWGGVTGEGGDIAPGGLTALSGLVLAMAAYGTIWYETRRASAVERIVKILPPFTTRDRSMAWRVEEVGGEETVIVETSDGMFAWRTHDAPPEPFVEITNLLVLEQSWRLVNAAARRRREDPLAVTVLLPLEQTGRNGYDPFELSCRAWTQIVGEAAEVEVERVLPAPGDFVGTRDRVRQTLLELREQTKSPQTLLDVTSGQPNQRIAATFAAIEVNARVGMSTGFRSDGQAKWVDCHFGM